VPGGFPFPGGFVLIGALVVNLIAAHSLRFKFTRKRLGIILTHLGLILLLCSELATAALATEGNMAINDGGARKYIERMRDFELAVIDPASKERDTVTVIPDSVLLQSMNSEREDVTHPDLPFDVRVNRWLANSTLARARASDRNLATTGLGRQLMAVRRPSSAGVSASQGIDTPSAYVTLLKDGEPLGTYMVTTLDNAIQTLPHQPQTVKVDGETYKIDLRFVREYTPYTLHLENFGHKYYTGTNTPRAAESKVILEDPERNVKRQVLISMNSPLYYRGQTFYQSGAMPDDQGTVLQVVNNPAWFLPYVSCTMIALGLLIHFASSLRRFLRRQRA
jgi:cytochrome c biogenesis protein ResB